MFYAHLSAQELCDAIMQIACDDVELEDAASAQVVDEHDNLISLLQIVDLLILAVAELDAFVEHDFGELLGGGEWDLYRSRSVA